MKLRCTAALALVGWYLMLPPDVTTRDGRLIFQQDAPFTKWTRGQEFGTESACKQFLASFPKECPNCQNFRQAVEFERVLNSRCVASDDPRLKSK